jgi:hypothetical protein
MRNRKAFPAWLIALVLLTLSCELEDEVRINRDGSGTYRVKVLVEKQLQSGIPEIREKALKDGFRLIEEGETATRYFLVMEHDFKNVGELDSKDGLSFTAAKAGWLRERYDFKASPPSSAREGFSRQLTIVMPARIERSTAGEVHGNTVVWDCTKGGTLEVTAEGFVLAPESMPLAVSGVIAAFGLATLISVGLVLFGLRRDRMALHCPSCLAEKSRDARFCVNCGAAEAVPALKGAGG